MKEALSLFQPRHHRQRPTRRTLSPLTGRPTLKPALSPADATPEPLHAAWSGGVMTGPIVTLISLSERAQDLARRWRVISDFWPADAPPTAGSVSLPDALCEPHQVTGAVALILADDAPDTRTGVLKLLDLLNARMTPAVILTPDGENAYADLASDRALAFTEDAPPRTLATTLHTLAARQPALEALLDELRTVRRFHGGLQDQMEQLQEELQLAAHVQRQFIPRALPEIDGLEFGLLFRPCGYVSGDIYDVARIDDRLTGFFVADAVGHGVPAALMTMVLAKAMPTLDDDGSLVGPAESLRRLNASLMKRTGRVQTFATAVCGVIDAHTGVVTIAGAGHPPPLRINPSDIRRIDTDGCLLGVFDDGMFNEVSFRLGHDEILLIHSDGFETAYPDPARAREGAGRPANALYLEHFRDIRDARARDDLETGMDALARSLDQQFGSLHQIDDETALVIARALPRTARNAA